MMIRRVLAIAALALLASGCATSPKEEIPWGIKIVAPEHYDIWGINIFLEKTGERSWRAPVGYVSCCWKGPRGPSGSRHRLDPFPELILIHWFSFAERKYYSKLIEVPPDLQKRMRKSAIYKTQVDVRSGPRHTMAVGLAPGGTVVVWIMNQIGNEIEVMRMKATEVPGDPEDFEVGTRNYLKEHGDYLEEHGIPTDGW
jgi:hypothetical protein